MRWTWDSVVETVGAVPMMMPILLLPFLASILIFPFGDFYQPLTVQYDWLIQIRVRLVEYTRQVSFGRLKYEVNQCNSN